MIEPIHLELGEMPGGCTHPVHVQHCRHTLPIAMLRPFLLLHQIAPDERRNSSSITGTRVRMEVRRAATTKPWLGPVIIE